jgi:hypothetical protein
MNDDHDLKTEILAKLAREPSTIAGQPTASSSWHAVARLMLHGPTTFWRTPLPRAPSDMDCSSPRSRSSLCGSAQSDRMSPR